ncbi:hypothetical protein TNCV_2942701 [Trichonephila clavipes]|nr:hypothetical protein TNCV_2942701 [Trichonephila clavipes]
MIENWVASIRSLRTTEFSQNYWIETIQAYGNIGYSFVNIALKQTELLEGLKLAKLKWLQEARKWSHDYGINPKQVILSPGRLDKVTTEHRHLHRIALWHYDDIVGQQLHARDLAARLEEEFPGKQLVAVLQRLAFMSCIQSGALL